MAIRNGRYSLDGVGVKSLVKWIDFALQLANVSQLVTVQTSDHCVERFVKNQSDFSLGYYNLMDESDNFTVATPAYSLSLHFLSGYNIHKYEKEQNRSRINEQGVMANLNSYPPMVYLLIFVWITVLIVLIFLRSVVMQRRPTFGKTLKKFVRYTYLVVVASDKRWRLLSFLLGLGLFLLLTPFFVLFKTNQVIAKEPTVIKSNEEIITQGAEMVSTHIQSSEVNFLKQKQDLGTGNIMDRIWRYFKGHSRQQLLEKSPETLTFLAKEITEGEIVFVASDAVAEGLRQVFCSWSVYPDLYQILRFHDALQDEFIAGSAFALPEPPETLAKKLQNAFEFNIPSNLKDSLDNYEGLRIIPNPISHRQRQMFLCQSKSLVLYRKDDLASVNFSFFARFFLILIVEIIFALLILSLELILSFCFKLKVIKKCRVEEDDLKRLEVEFLADVELN